MTKKEMLVLAAQNLRAVEFPNDIQHIASSPRRVKAYAVVLPGDSCVVYWANSLEEVKRELLRICNMINGWHTLDTSAYEIPMAYRGVPVTLAEVCGGTPFIIYTLNEIAWPKHPSGMTIVQYMKQLYGGNV